MNYEQAKNMFETTRKRKLANNTYLEKFPAENPGEYGYAIALHNSRIIKFYPDKTVLSSCGWRTVTTRNRLNEFTVFNIWQTNGIWYINAYLNWRSEDAVVFADGITYQDGKWLNAGSDVNGANRLRKQIRQYAKDFVIALEAGQVPKPSTDDCWYCCLVAQDGKTLGEHTDGDHIINHIKEKYYVPSLCINACKRFGVSKAAYWWLQGLWGMSEQCNAFAVVAKEQIERAIRRYCYQYTGSAV